jgi:tetratricopeptide (TPR) repeat protein
MILLAIQVVVCTTWLWWRLPTSLGRLAESPTRQPQRPTSDIQIADVEPRFEGLGNYSRPISTKSQMAQDYFDQGLAFFYGFNADEASESFEAAAVADPECAMLYWGIALSNGPHLNNRIVGGKQAAKARDSLGKARTKAGYCSPVERALIVALGTRIVDPPPPDRAKVDIAYAAAMNRVWTQYPSDPDVGALAADALLNVKRWEYWTLDGKPQEGTVEAIGILNAVLANHPNHPYALHLLVHAVEASPHPESALPAADRLRSLAPGLEHLLHMPSHIDVRLGHWEAARRCNELAIAADHHYRTITGNPDTDRNLGMALHNHCMLAYCAMMQGRRRKSTEIIHEMFSEIPSTFAQGNSATVDPFHIMPYEVHLRFGEWQEMLAEPRPGGDQPVAHAFWNYARGISFAATNEVRKAKEEQRQFLVNRREVPNESRLRANSLRRLMDVAEKMLAGEILYREAKPEDAVASLREAVRLEDNLSYAEPPDWIMPVRHSLGATLIAAGRAAEAESVYRDDLARYPENGWSLHGLMRSLKMQDKKAEAAKVLARFELAWQNADFKISSSCCCLPGQ